LGWCSRIWRSRSTCRSPSPSRSSCGSPQPEP
jgi:hypothetical protein